MRIMTLAIVLLTAHTAAAQRPAIPHEVLEAAATFGDATFLDEFVPSGTHPDDESLAEFLWDTGFESHLETGGWHAFTVSYVPAPAGVKVKLTNNGTQLVVRIDQTWTPRAPRRQTGLEPFLNPPASRPQGVFRPSISSFDGLTLSTAGLTNATLHRAIRTLLDARTGGR